MSTADRRTREKAALRQEILAAARELFITEGYERVSMRRIAERIDYSPTTIYLYFKDKSELLFHVSEQTFTMLVARGQRIRSGPGDPLTRLKLIGRHYVEVGLKHPNDYKVTFMVSHEPGHLNERYEHSMGHRAFALLEEGVAECIACGVFRPVDLRLASQTLWAAVHGITSLLIARPDFPWAEQDRTIDLLLDVVCAGFASEAAGTRTAPAQRKDLLRRRFDPANTEVSPN